MGMRGYAGSAAQREAALDAVAEHVRWRDVEISHPLVEKYLAMADTMFGRPVLLRKEDRVGRGHHYQPHHDEGGWYIRMAKRGQIKRYLTGCRIIYVDGDPSVFEFKTSASETV